MTKALVCFEGERIVSMQVQGHAGYAKAGEDIVCAAISLLTFTCGNAMESILGTPPLEETDEKHAMIRIALPKSLTERQEHDAQVIFRTVLQGMQDLQASYPKYFQLTKFDGRQTP